MNFSIPDEKEIRTAFAEEEEAVIALFGEVTAQVEELAARLEKQSGILKDLKARLSKNSRNSGKPPSSDGYSKPNRTESPRKSGRNPNGGQPGHTGHTLERSENPDYTEMHKPDECGNCGIPLGDVAPVIRIEVTCGTEKPG